MLTDKVLRDTGTCPQEFTSGCLALDVLINPGVSWSRVMVVRAI